MAMQLVREVWHDMQAQRQALARMAEIERLLLEPDADVDALTAEYDALNGSWTGERWIEMDVRTPEEQAAIDQQEATKAATESGHEVTLRQRVDLALGANDTTIAEGESWLAANGSGTLTASVLSTAVRWLVRAMLASLRQRNGIIRLVLRKLDSVQGTATAPPK